MDPEGEASYLHSTTFANDIIEICRQVHTSGIIRMLRVEQPPCRHSECIEGYARLFPADVEIECASGTLCTPSTIPLHHTVRISISASVALAVSLTKSAEFH